MSSRNEGSEHATITRRASEGGHPLLDALGRAALLAVIGLVGVLFGLLVS